MPYECMSLEKPLFVTERKPEWNITTSYRAINQGNDELKPTLPRLSTLSTFS